MKILDIALKDLKRYSRSMFLIGMAFAAPLLIIGLFYFAFGGMKSGDVSITPIKVGVVNADVLPADSPLNVPLGDNIRSMFFDQSVASWITASDYPTEAAARAAVNKQVIGVAVIIPETFTADYFAGSQQTPVLVLQDPTLTIGPTVVRDMIVSMLDGFAGGSVTMQTVIAQAAANGTNLDPARLPVLLEQYSNWYIEFQRALFHDPDSAALMVVSPAAGAETQNTMQSMLGMIVVGQLIFFSFFTGAYAMMSILNESEEGTLARIFTTPTNRTKILAGKFLAVLLTVIIQGVVMMIAGHTLFGVNWGEPGAMTLSFLGQMFASVGLAVLLVSFIKTSKQAGPIFGSALTGLGMIGGLFTANISMPAAFNAMGNFTPQGWVLKAWRLTLTGQPASELVVPFLVMTTMGVVLFAIGAVMFRRRFA